MRVSTRVAMTLLCLLMLASAGGCAMNSRMEAPAEPKPIIRVAGSGSHLILLKQLIGAYPARDEVRFKIVADTHSAAGAQGVLEGALDIAGSSGGLSRDHTAQGLRFVALSRDGLILAVHPSVRVEALTAQQVRDIYAGRVTDWSELGGGELPVVVLDRDEDSSAKKAFGAVILGDTVISSSTVPLFYEEEMIEGVSTTPGAIAYYSLGAHISQKVATKLVRLDGVTPSVATVESGEYAPTRTLGLVFDATKDDPALKRFVQWASSPEASEYLRKSGYAAPGAAQQR